MLHKINEMGFQFLKLTMNRNKAQANRPRGILWKDFPMRASWMTGRNWIFPKEGRKVIDQTGKDQVAFIGLSITLGKSHLFPIVFN